MFATGFLPGALSGVTVAVIPGAGMGAWSWHPVARHLPSRGHRVDALTMPGLSYGDSPAGLRPRLSTIWA